MVQDQQIITLETEYLYIVAIILAIVWSKKRNLNLMKRMQRSRKVSSTMLDDQKIIVALEIENLLIESSNRKQKDFLPLQIQTNQSVPIKKLKNLFGYGAYYRLLHQRSKIKAFFKALNGLDNVELYLYTSLHKTFAQKILQKLGIEDYFPEQHRRYCQQEDKKVNEKKHPSWVDNHTRRVMIVTPSKSDYDEEDKKYFLLLNKVQKSKMLKSALRLIKHIIQRASSVDDLHNEMQEVKAQIESDYENQEGVSN